MKQRNSDPETEQTPPGTDAKARRAQGNGRFGRAMLVTVACLLVVVPAGVAVFAMTRYNQAAATETKSEPVSTFAVKHVEELGKQDGLLTGAWVKGAAVYAPAWSGLVSGLPVHVGDVVHSYDTVIEIDGVARQGWRTDHPFYRALAPADKGDDVKTLQKALSDLGLLHGVSSGVMDGATVAAVKKYSKKIGFAQAQEVFDPGWVVFLPSDEITIATINVAVSAVAPAAGEAVFAARDALVDAVVAPATGVLPQPAEQWEMIMDEQEFRFNDAGHVDTDQLSTIEKSSSWGKKDSDDGKVRVGIQRVAPLSAQRVPITAVGVGSNGSHCVWTADGQSKDQNAKVDYAAVAVELIPDRTQPGVAMVTGLPDGSTVVANPRAALGLMSCP